MKVNFMIANLTVADLTIVKLIGVGLNYSIMTEQMINVELDGREKRLNARNIAYIITKSDNVRFRGYFMLSLSFILTVLPSVVLFPNPITIGVSALIGLIISVLLYLKIRGDDIQTVGTVNEAYEITTNNMNSLRSAFENSEQESIHVKGVQKTIFSKMNYSYHITPKNIVSIDHIDRSIPRIMSVTFVLLSVILIGFFSYSYAGIERLSGVTVGVALLAVTSIFVVSNRPDFLEIEFTNNEKKRIPLSKDRCEEIIEHIQGERKLSEIGPSENKPEITEPEGDDLKRLEDDDKKQLEKSEK